MSFKMKTSATLPALDTRTPGRERSQPDWIQYFILSAGVILLAAALTRFLIAAGNAQVLSLPDPMLGIPLRYAVLLVGGFELAVALICLFGKRLGLQIGWLAWLGDQLRRVLDRIGLATLLAAGDLHRRPYRSVVDLSRNHGIYS